MMFRALIILIVLAEVITATAQSTGDSLSQKDDHFEERVFQGKEDTEEWMDPAGNKFRSFSPVILNKADSNSLSSIGMLSPEQIQHFLLYRRVMGKLVSIFELQAIPGWDSTTIQRLLPYVTLNERWTLQESWSTRWTAGQSQLLFRYEKLLEKKRDSGPGNWMGAPHRVLMRYSYQFQHLLAYGLTIEKDPGEKFFSPKYHYGPDFKSGYLLLRDMGAVKTLILGDYAVNIGQGLLQWQSLAFGKGGDLTTIKREAAVLLPYRSLQENNFYRGAAFTCGWRHTEATLFLSYKKMDARVEVDSTGDGSRKVRTILTDGLHRTAAELANRKNWAQFSGGGQIVYSLKQGHISVNMVCHQLNLPLSSSTTPYKLYAPRGSRFMNYGFDYAYTFQHIHFFGEWAAAQEGSKAGIFGALVVLHPKLDWGLLYRSIDPGYYSFYSDAFLENSGVNNERGCYTGLSFRPSAAMQVQLYVDVFRFPWLKYRVDRPSEGVDYQSALMYTPNKKWSLRLRFLSSQQPQNENASEEHFHRVIPVSVMQFRSQMTFSPNRSLQLSFRMDWKRVRGAGAPEEGWYTYVDLHCKGGKAGSAQFRLLYFETASFQSRLFAYENGVRQQFRIASFYGKGLRWTISYNRTINMTWKKDHFRKFNFSLFLAQTLSDHRAISSVLYPTVGHPTLDARLQGTFHF